MKTLSLLAALAIACGGADPADSTTPAAAEPPAAEPAKHEGHGKLTPELEAFHDLLSPRWHAAPGEQRRADTCAVIADFRTRSAAIKTAAAPAGAEAAAWTEAGSSLEQSVADLATACGDSDLARFDTAFEAVHTRYHHAMELVVGEHDMRGGHGGEHEGHGDHGAASHGENRDVGH
jgi:hypothetical protein